MNTNTLPESFLKSKILTSANLQQLSTIGQEVPNIDPTYDDDKLKNIIQYYSLNPDDMETELHYYAKELLDKGKITEAWQILLTTV